MPPFPLPSFGPHIEEILDHALHTLNLFDNQYFLWVLTAFNLALAAILWAIHKIRHPPELDT